MKQSANLITDFLDFWNNEEMHFCWLSSPNTLLWNPGQTHIVALKKA